jgi:hypothetical protein
MHGQVKCRLQSQSPVFQAVEKHAYDGMVGGLRAIFRERGLRGLYQGVDAVMLRLFWGSAAQMAGYDIPKQWLLNQGVCVHMCAPSLREGTQ